MGLFDRDPTRALRIRSGSLLAASKFAEALPVCQHVVELAPRLADGWSELGWALLGLERYDEAISACETAIFLNERHVWAWNNKGAALTKLRRSEEALAAYDEAVALDPTALKYGRITAHYNRLRELITLQRYDEALASANLLVRLAAKQANVWVGRAQALIGLKRYDEAEAAFIQALKVAPADRFALVQLCMFYRNQLHEYAQALAVCERLLAVRPDDRDAHSMKGDFLRLLCKPVDACAAYERAIDQNAPSGGRSSSFWVNYGLTLTHVGHYGDALAAFDNAEMGQPPRSRTFAIVENNRGSLLSSLERHELALDYYERAIVADPTSALTTANIAEELVEMGRFVGAAEEIDKVFALDARFGCGWHAKGLLAAARGEFEEARAALQTSIEIEPSHSAHHADLASVCIMLGDIEQARTEIDFALAICPGDMRWWRIKSQALRAAGKLGEAAEAEQRSAALLAEQTAQVDAYLAAKRG